MWNPVSESVHQTCLSLSLSLFQVVCGTQEGTSFVSFYETSAVSTSDTRRTRAATSFRQLKGKLTIFIHGFFLMCEKDLYVELQVQLKISFSRMFELYVLLQLSKKNVIFTLACRSFAKYNSYNSHIIKHGCLE